MPYCVIWLMLFLNVNRYGTDGHGLTGGWVDSLLDVTKRMKPKGTQQGGYGDGSVGEGIFGQD